KSAEQVFSENEIQFMEKLCPKLEGNSKKLKNKHLFKSIAWASWIIARLGGWKGYESQSPPGPITIVKGIIKFYQQLQGWELALELMKPLKKDVYRE
ncbi:MAG: hypothetical protein CSA15_08050, partial [Candidatus Delongbacteria bacterium]